MDADIENVEVTSDMITDSDVEYERLSEHIISCRERAADQMKEIELRFNMNNFFNAKREDCVPGLAKNTYILFLEETLINAAIADAKKETLLALLEERILDLQKEKVKEKVKETQNEKEKDKTFISFDDLIS